MRRLGILAGVSRARLPGMAVASLLFFAASLAQAISLYDIVQLSQAGKSDAQIIDLIKTTTRASSSMLRP